jgi:hypothetical protein
MNRSSVAHYLVLNPDTRQLSHHGRGRAPITLASGLLRLDPPGIEVAVTDLFGTA